MKLTHVACLLLSLFSFTVVYAETMPIPYEQVVRDGMGSKLADDGAITFMGLFDDSDFIYKITLTGPQVTEETANAQLQFNNTANAAIGKLLDGEGLEFGFVGTSEQNRYQLDDPSNWVDVTTFCNANDIFVDLNEDYQTHSSAQIALWLGFSSTLGPELTYQDISAGGFTVEIEGYEVVDAIDKTANINYSQITPAGLIQQLQNAGAGALSDQFDQDFVYHITMTGPLVTEGSSVTKLLLDQIAPLIVGKLDQTNGNEMAEVGTELYVDSYQFDTDGQWIDITTYCNANDVNVGLMEDWIQHSSAILHLWIGLNTSLGEDLLYQELSAGGVQVTVDGYNVVDAIDQSVAINYSTITESGLEQLLQNQGAGAFANLFNQQYCYQITLSGPNVTEGNSENKLQFGQIADVIIGQLEQTNGQEFAVAGTELYADSYQFETDAQWVDITTYCNANNIFVELDEDWVVHSAATLNLWVGFGSSLGAELLYQELGDGGVTVNVQGYEIISLEENEIAINYDNITKEQLDDLLDADGASAFNGLFDQPYVYRFVLSSQSGENENFTKIISHLESIPDAAIGYAYMNEESPNAMVGINQASAHTISESWEDLTTHAATADVYMELDIGLFTHHASTVYLWMGFSNSIGNTLLYDLFDEFSAPPAHFIIDGYNIQTEILSETVDFGYLPLTKTELDCMLVLDGAENFSDILIAPYIFNMYLKSDSDIVTAVKMQLNLDQAPIQAIGLGSGVNNPQAAIGDAINNQHNVDTENWENISDFANTQELFIILNDDPQTLVPGELSLWFGFNTPPGHSLSYENLSGFLKPDSFSLKPYRIINDQEISQVTINTPAEYQLKYLQEGDNYYLDRNYYLEGIPDDLENLVWVVPNNIDKNNADTEFITLDLDNPGTVYIAYDRRAESPPNWLTENYTSSAYQIQVSDFSTPMNVWQKEVPAGELVLGGNMAAGAEGAESQYIVILDIPTGIPPVADFTMSTDMGEAPLVVNFQDQSTGYITSWNWDFGDGESSTEQNPSHTFQYVDTFKVTLTVNSSDGTDSKSDTVIVTEAVPVAKFGADVMEGPVPLTVQFSDSSSGNIESWLWEFGDGESSSEQNPSHQYTSADTFTVTLTVSGPGGTAKLSKTDFIKVAFPTGIANMNAAPDRFELYSNYPNPFNPQTQITFDVPKAQHINITIFNINGSVVEMLVDEQKSQGRYTVTWNAMQHSSGTYFIRMQTPEYNRTVKCILLK